MCRPVLLVFPAYNTWVWRCHTAVAQGQHATTLTSMLKLRAFNAFSRCGNSGIDMFISLRLICLFLPNNPIVVAWAASQDMHFSKCAAHNLHNYNPFPAQVSNCWNGNLDPKILQSLCSLELCVAALEDMTPQHEGHHWLYWVLLMMYSWCTHDPWIVFETGQILGLLFPFELGRLQSRSLFWYVLIWSSY